MDKEQPTIPSLPKAWSELTWQQLTDVWQVKLRYAGYPDAARAAALLLLCNLTSVPLLNHQERNTTTGERLYHLYNPANPGLYYSVTARALAYYAKRAIPWFDFPYADRGEKEQRDDKGKVVTERREARRGYVSPMRDAMILPQDKLNIGGSTFELPQACCANLTFEQYRALQSIASLLFQEGNTEEEVTDLQSRFLANCLVPEQENPNKDRFMPKQIFRYDSLRAEGLVPFFRLHINACPTLFPICFQVYQTAMAYYEEVYPLLFSGEGKHDPLRDALTSEAGTINTIMKYQGYSDPQSVYEANLPVILDVLNTMSKEAKEIEKMNAKIKRR